MDVLIARLSQSLHKLLIHIFLILVLYHWISILIKNDSPASTQPTHVSLICSSQIIEFYSNNSWVLNPEWSSLLHSLSHHFINQVHRLLGQMQVLQIKPIFRKPFWRVLLLFFSQEPSHLILSPLHRTFLLCQLLKLLVLFKNSEVFLIIKASWWQWAPLISFFDLSKWKPLLRLHLIS